MNREQLPITAPKTNEGDNKAFEIASAMLMLIVLAWAIIDML